MARKIAQLYIAAPFFSWSQLGIVQAVEALCRANEIPCFSPRRDQPQYRPEGGVEEANRIFVTNVQKLTGSDVVLAYIDDFDPGTVWEMGLAYSRDIRTIAFTTHDYGLNIMLSQSCYGFLKGLDAVDAWMGGDDEVLIREWKGGHE